MQKRRLKQNISMMVVLLLSFSLLLTGCGGKTNEAATQSTEAISSTNTVTEDSKKLEPVELVWYTVGTPQQDQQVVTDEMNKILKEKINVSLKVNTIDWGSYKDKMQLIISSGEPYDLCFTSSWSNDYVGNSIKGAFLQVDDLLKQYGSNILSSVPSKYWDAARVNNKLYGILNYQIYAQQDGFILNKSLVDKYKFDYTSIKKMADIEPFFENVKNGEKGITPYLASTQAIPLLFDMNTGYLFDNVTGDQNSPLAINVKDQTLKVINRYETNEAMQMFKMLHEWYQKGYIRKDAASLKDYTAEEKSGKYAAYKTVIKPGVEVEQQAIAGYTVYAAPDTNPYLSTTGIIATLTAISKDCKNPQRAMMFYDLIYSDKVLYNLMCFGIKDKHYTQVSDDTVEPVANSAYNPNTDWEFGNQFNAFYRKGQKPGIWEDTKKMNDSAEISPLLGFAYNSESMKTQLAQVNAIVGEYVPGLATGTLDPVKALPEMNTKLKNAGLDQLITDAQKQISDWKATK